MRRIAKRYLIYSIVLLIILIGIFGLKMYADNLRRENIKEQLNKNRRAAIEKLELAQTVWLPYRFDKTYQNYLKQIREIEQRPAVVIYFKDNTTQDDISNLIKELQSIKGVKNAKFISQDEALSIYKEWRKNDPALLELISPNILPASIEVYLDDFTVRSQVEQIAKSKAFVTKVIQSHY